MTQQMARGGREALSCVRQAGPHTDTHDTITPATTPLACQSPFGPSVPRPQPMQPTSQPTLPLTTWASSFCFDRKRIAVTTYSAWISSDNNFTSLLGRVGNTNKCYIRKHQHTWLHPEDKHRSNTRDACEKHKGTFFWPRYIYSYVLSDVRRLALFLRPLKTSHYCLVHWHYNLDKTPLFSRAIHENKDSRRYIWVHLSLFSRLPLKGSQRPIPRGSSKTPQNKQCVARPFTAHT